MTQFLLSVALRIMSIYRLRAQTSLTYSCSPWHGTFSAGATSDPSLSLIVHIVQPGSKPIDRWSSLPAFARLCHFLATVLMVIATSGCSTIEYYRHALTGQFEIWRKQEPISELLTRDTLATDIREKLMYAVSARNFAFGRLALPDNGSYRDYVNLERDFVIWNVFATPELSLVPNESCYPFVGCFDYRGFFAEAHAKRYAENLRRQGNDVFIGGVAAYSTLGWLDDPTLSSILKWEKARIAEIIFHELAHQQLYVKDDTSFNESFAMTVAMAGLQLWIPLQGGDLAKLETEQARERQFIALVLRFRSELEKVYLSDHSDHDKRMAKNEILASLDAEYKLLKVSWNGDTSYDEWMRIDLNNAKIASVSTYHNHVAGFMTILEQHNYDFSAFYTAVEQLAKLEPAERVACLSAISKVDNTYGPSCSKIINWPQ